MLVIGLGNPDRGDDIAGILVARALAEGGVNAIQHCGGTLDLIEIWEQAAEVIVVDAVFSGAVPGTLHVWNAQTTTLRRDFIGSSTHGFGLADTIELARTLDRLPELIVYGIEAAQFIANTPPSPQILAGVERAIDHIASHVRKLSS